MIVGITGGIGSGKSVLSQILIALGYSVFNSDVEAKNILQYNTEIKLKITAKFGGDSYFNDLPNRAFLAEKVFSTPDNLEFLNGLIHPQVQKNFEDWQVSKSKERILFKEAAILIETGSYRFLDKLILVEADAEIRIQRVMERDGVSKEQVEKRMATQMSDTEKRAYADFIVNNNGDRSLLKQALEVLKELGETI